MNMAPAAALDAPGRASWRQRFLRSPYGRIAIYALFATALFALTTLAVSLAGWTGDAAARPLRLAGVLLRQVIPFLGAYLLLVRLVERRKADELAPAKLLPHGALGIAIALGFLATVVAILRLAGGWHLAGFNDDVKWGSTLLVGGLGAAVAEETLFRGVLFRLTEQAWGTWGALAFSALLFGAAHLGNPGATWWTSLAIAVEAGVLLGVVFHVSRSLPLCIGLHMAWNFTEGAVLGSAVSGRATAGWLASEFTGPDWLTGGAFGIEASAVTVAVSLVFSATLLAWRRPTRAGAAAC